MNTRRIHDVFPKQALDRSLLFGVFILGATGICFIKLLNYGALLSAIWAVVVLTLYLFASVLLGRIKIEPETVGDNCYYLGFLFTLTSLAVTLFHLDGFGSDQAIGEVISGFGVALASTIFGVLYRVALMQLKIDFVARDLEERSHVLAVSREFRAHLSESLKTYKLFSIEVAQHQAELLNKTSEALESIVEEIQKRFELKVEIISDQFKDSIKKAGEVGSAAVSEGISASVVNVKNEFSYAAKKISENLMLLSSDQKTLLANFSQLQLQANASTTSFTSALMQIGAQLSQTQEAMRSSSIAMVQSFEDTHIVLLETQDKISRTAVSLTNSLDLQDLEGRISNVFNGLTQASQDSFDAVSRFKTHLESLDDSVQQVSGTFDRSCETLSTAIRVLSYEIKETPLTQGIVKDL